MKTQLPSPPLPAGAYQPWILTGNLLFISGQFPYENGQLRHVGRIGAELSEEQGIEAARLCALNVLAQIHTALGNCSRLRGLARVEGHIATAPGWHNSPRVLDGASELFVSMLGERGRHARTAFCRSGLPLNASVELVVIASVAG